MVAIYNIYGTTDWATKVTSLLEPGEWAQYDDLDYDHAKPSLPWIIAEEDGATRAKIATTLLDGSTFGMIFMGFDNLEGVEFKNDLVVGPGTLIRPGTKVGQHVYMGAGTIIDINCTIDDHVTIGDNVLIQEGAHITEGVNIKSGSIIEPNETV